MATASPPPDATRVRWPRSLYWRVAAAIIAAIALTIAAQGLVLLTLLDRQGQAGGPPPRGFARLVAGDLAAALADDFALDLDAFLRQEYQQRLFPFVVVLRDGRVARHNGGDASPEVLDRARALLDEGAARLRRRDGRGSPDRGRGGGRGELFRPDGGVRSGGRGPEGPAPVGLIVVGGAVVGVVVATPETLLRRFGPTLLAAGLAALVGATAFVSAVVLAPVRRRLAAVSAAAEAVGAGQLDARAPEAGADEVAALAASFNRMAAQLDERRRQVAATDQARRLLLADVSHELGTPLTSMRGYLDTLSSPPRPLDEATRARYLSIVSDETRRLETLVGDLLDLSRLEAGGLTLAVDDVAVEALFGAVLARHGRDADDAGVRLSTEIAPGAELVRGDARRLEQALQNLVANALRHTPAGGRVELTARLDAPDLVLTVRDTGSGIPAEHLPHVFDRFYKVDAARSPERGSGLGLSIVKAVVDRHGGAVAVSTSGAGTIFELRLPAGDSE